MSLVRRWGLPALVLCLPALALSFGAARAADDHPASADGKAVDAIVHKMLRDVINEGADMYNATGRYTNMERDYAGCYHLYQGALMATRPFLGAHPDLQKDIDAALATARDTPQVERRAFVLRAAIDKIRDAVNPNPVAVGPPPPPVKVTKAAGKVVSAAKGKLTVNVGGEDRSFTVPETAMVTIDGKEGGLETIKKDSSVTVTSKGDQVLNVEAKSPSEPPPPPPPPPAKETKTTGKVTKIEKDTLTLKDDAGKNKSFIVPDTAKVTIDGKDGVLQEVKEDSAVTVTSKGDEVTKVEAKAPTAPPPPPPPPEAKTLWDRLGGEANVAKVVDDFVNTAGKDPKVNFWRDPTKVPSKEEVAALKKHLVEFVSSVTGGPLKYEGKSMKEVHKGMKITNAEFDAAAKDLQEALEKNGAMPDDEKAVMAVVESTRKDIVEEAKPPEKDKVTIPEKDKAAPPEKDKPEAKDKVTIPEKDKAAPPPEKDK